MKKSLLLLSTITALAAARADDLQWGIRRPRRRLERRHLDDTVLATALDFDDRLHEGARRARIHQWDGAKWVFTTDWIEARAAVLRPMIEDSAKKYATETNLPLRDCSKEG